MNKKITSLISALLLSTTACENQQVRRHTCPEIPIPEIIDGTDQTGDGLEDIMINVGGSRRLFVKRPDGLYDRSYWRTDGQVTYFLLDGTAIIDEHGGVSYIQSSNPAAYFNDGTKYVLSPQ